MKIQVQDLEATIKIDQAGAMLLTKALMKQYYFEIECNCEECKDKKAEVKAQELMDLLFIVYPISKLARHGTINIPSKNDIVKKINENRQALKDNL